MQENRTEWQRITLPGSEGPQVYIEVVPRGGREEIGVVDSIPFEQLSGLLTSIAGGVGDALDKVNVKKVTAELSIEFGVESGNLVALIARGSGKANLKICLDWEKPE